MPCEPIRLPPGLVMVMRYAPPCWHRIPLLVYADSGMRRVFAEIEWWTPHAGESCGIVHT